MPRALVVALLASLAACGGSSSSGDDDDGAVAPDAAVSSTAGEVRCDTTVCSGSTAVCCVALVLTPPSLETRCVADIAECGNDSRWECDEAADCAAGERCCMLNVSGGTGNTLIGTCEAECNLFQQELCQGHGTGDCTGGRFCCQPGDSTLGSCTADQAECDASGMP